MNGIPTASLRASCDTISHRALSTAVEIEDILRQGASENPGLDRLQFLDTKLWQFRQHTDQLQQCLGRISVISTRLQDVVSRSVNDCDTATAIVQKQIQDVTPQHAPRLNSDTISTFLDLFASYSRLFAFITQLLYSPDAAYQDSKLDHVDGKRIVSEAESLASRIIAGIQLVADEESGEATTEEAEEPSRSAALPDAARRPSKSGLAKGLSSLTNSLKAVTASIRPRPEPFVSPLCQAASRGEVPPIKGLLAQGANINGRNEEGNTALICAIQAGQPDAALFLLESGADVSVRDSSRKRRPPLFHALDVGDFRTAEALLQRGASVKDKNLVGLPFFVDLVLSERVDAVRLCLQYGADATSKDLTGRPIICHAVNRGNAALARLLLEHGADPNTRDVLGNTLLLSTIRKERLSFSQSTTNATDLAGSACGVSQMALRGVTTPPPTRSPKAAASNRSAVSPLVQLLLAHGADPNIPDTWGLTALAHAAVADDVPLLRALLARGADPNRSVHGDLLLVNAIDARRWAQVRALVEEGRVDVRAADARGRTALDAALQSRDPDVLALVLRGGSSGADAAATDARSLGPVDAVATAVAGMASVTREEIDAVCADGYGSGGRGPPHHSSTWTGPTAGEFGGAAPARRQAEGLGMGRGWGQGSTVDEASPPSYEA